MASDPALDYARPNVEALVWASVRNLAPDGAGITTWAYSAVPLPAPVGWLHAVSVQVDVRGRTRTVAWDRADAARRRLLALPWTAWADGVISRVDAVEAPFWNPDPENGRPRYTARYEVRAHPRPATRLERTA